MSSFNEYWFESRPFEPIERIYLSNCNKSGSLLFTLHEKNPVFYDGTSSKHSDNLKNGNNIYCEEMVSVIQYQ